MMPSANDTGVTTIVEAIVEAPMNATTGMDHADEGTHNMTGMNGNHSNIFGHDNEMDGLIEDDSGETQAPGNQTSSNSTGPPPSEMSAGVTIQIHVMWATAIVMSSCFIV
ncbi:expressed unknown protein [Seminavis robusta]|uniref:Uncharacterized protein n=1 Tax=Seminavis robusta TaxID=568900 RepID=A0A9N8HW28_9STRA|nr:expressed unknown protein [Seminavis robusta]CAB9529448.1 expressed unknown protein [Seminavis robusta]|eukprot:Sro1275_g258480.1 n/a (110) ;mRNA; f:19552-19881